MNRTTTSLPVCSRAIFAAYTPRCEVHRGVRTQMRSALLPVNYRFIFSNFMNRTGLEKEDSKI